MSERVITQHYGYRGRLLKLRVATVRLPDGFKTTREVVEHPGAVAIIPLLDSKRILVTKQYRIAAKKHMIEIPAGTLERGENPLSCAKRELVEETGYSARRIRKLFSCYLAPGYSTERIHFFLATRLVPKKTKKPEDERISVRAISLTEGVRAVERGRIQDAKTICALYYLITHGIAARRTRRPTVE